MLPNMRLSGTANDSMSDFLGLSSAAVSRSAASIASNPIGSTVKNNVAAAAAAASYTAASRSFAASVSSSGWGPLPTSSPSSASTSFASTLGGGQSRTLSDHVKESTGWSQQTASATSMPWAAAVKAPIEHHNQHSLLHNPAALAAAAASFAATNAFVDNGSTIGSWTSPETNSATRSGWNADGSMKSDGSPDDGTAIWGNPSTKKTGIDWAEKESSLNHPQVNNSEKRIQKSEPIISSLNGTEAWGAPAMGNGTNSNDGLNQPSNNSQKLASIDENSGNNYVGKSSTINNEPLSWGESSSLQQAATKNRNSSPTSDSVWNYISSNSDSEIKRKTSTDWLSSSVSSNNSNNRIDELSKQLEATNVFNGNTTSSASLLSKNSSSAVSNNPNLDNNSRQSSASVLSNSNGVNMGLVSSGTSSNAIHDLKQQLSANFTTNDLLESSPIRQQQVNSGLSSNNQSQSQLGTYSLGVTPSRELLKQMVHQIQLAVQAGHLNAHILNQPLSTPTLQLVYTLLQQIKLLQQFQEIQQRTQIANKSNDPSNNAAHQSNLELQITRVQQNISLLQKAITQQQAALTKNESLVESSLKQQQASGNSSYNNSYANISKLSTNMKVPSNTSNMSNTISSNSNIDSFRRSSLIDSLGNSNSDQLRSTAQANFEANANLDKNLSPLLQTTSSLSNILNNKQQQNDYNKHQNFTNNHNPNQQSKGNLLSSAAQPAAAAWLPFAQGGDLSGIQNSSLGSSGWSRQDQPQFNNELLSELGSAKAWRGASFLSADMRDTPNVVTSASSTLTQGLNSMARPDSTTDLKQMSEQDILNKDQSLFYDWTSSNQNSDAIKRNFDAVATSSSFSSAIGGLSLQSNPWLFAPTSSNSLNVGNNSLDNFIDSSKQIGVKTKSDNGNTDKIRVGADPLEFLNSNSTTGSNAQRALYDWGDMASSGTSSLHYNNDNGTIGSNKQTAPSSNLLGGRPAPPPGLMSNLGQLGSSSVNEISSILESEKNKQINHNETQQMPSRESSSSLWSGAWFD